MKKMKKILGTISILFMGIASLFAVSCNKDKKVSYVFDTNEGVSIPSASVKTGKEYTLPVPVREGYVFEGWYGDAAFSGESIVSITAEANQTFYAKWVKVFTVSLELDGGSLSTTTLSIKEGATIADVLQDYTPTKAGLVFGAWFTGRTALSSTAKMTGDLTLTAKYKAAYTIEVYKQKLDSAEYEKDADITGYEYVGENFDAEQSIAGFSLTSDSVSEKVISATETNVYQLYYTRNTYTVSYRSNYPDDKENTTETISVKYGTKLTALSKGYSVEGYCLTGWATSADGDVEYKADSISDALYNPEEGSAPVADEFVPERNMVLYAVWNKGYTDIFGGNDYIYIDKENSIAYLSRGPVFFVGEYYETTDSFVFYQDKKVMTEGKINGDGTYSYNDASRANISYFLYSIADGTNSSITLQFGLNNDITYGIKGENEIIAYSYGTFYVDKDGYYVASFGDDQGEMSGKTFTFKLVNLSSSNGVKHGGFIVRNDEEAKIGTLIGSVVNTSGSSLGSLTYYIVSQQSPEPIYTLELSGFGTATYKERTSSTTYYYTIDGDKISLRKTSNGDIDRVVCMIEYTIGTSEIKGFLDYNQNLDTTATATGNESLTLDGVYIATYNDNGTIYTGSYVAKASALGGTIIHFYSATKNALFYLSEDVSSFTEKTTNYGEYYYNNDDGVQKGVLLVIDETDTNEATVYIYNEDSEEYEKVAIGTYQINSETDLYTFTTSQSFSTTAVSTLVDMSQIDSFEFALNISDGVHYWYSQTIDDVKTVNTKIYVDGENTLTLVNGFAVYQLTDGSVAGTYTIRDDGILSFMVSGRSFYFELNEQNSTCILLTGLPYKAYALTQNGRIDSTTYLDIDGKYGAIYTTETDTCEGTYVSTEEETLSGAYVYTFTAKDHSLTFNFLMLSTSTQSVFARYDASTAGSFQSVCDGALILDGYAFRANYIDSDGTHFDSISYTVIAENIVRVIYEGEYKFFALKSNNEFEKLGDEYGSYIYRDNQSVRSQYFLFDGKGGLKVRVYNEEDDGATYIDYTGTYEKNDDGNYTLRYTMGAQAIVLVGNFSSYTYDGTDYNSFEKFYQTVVSTYVNEADWSIITLDGIGNAVKYGKNGVKETGSYTIISDKLFYYVNSKGTEQGVYAYSVLDGTATPIQLEDKGYFTENLEVLLFSASGFIDTDNERSFYEIVDNTIYIYYREEENAQANAYGFVKEEFGSFADIITYHGKTYYENEGFAITFARSELGKNEYPVLVKSGDTEKFPLRDLVFSPNGRTFSVAGKVSVLDKYYDCTVVSSINGESEKELYILVGSFRFDITLNYQGKNSTYTINGMQSGNSSYSAKYLSDYLLYLKGSTKTPPVNIGQVLHADVYDKEGKIVDTECYIDTSFLEASGYIDRNGNLLNLTKAPYTYYETNDIYVAEVVGSDGYTYRMHFYFSYNSMFRLYEYTEVITRVEKITIAGGDTLTVERIAFGEEIGKVISIVIQNGETKKDFDNMDVTNLLDLGNGKVFAIERQYDKDGKITTTDYYKITLVEGKESSTKEKLGLLSSATIIKETVSTVYSSDGKSYADVSQTEGILYFSYTYTDSTDKEQTEEYIVVTSVYNATTYTYTVQTKDQKEFIIIVENGVVSMEKNEEY